MFQHSIILILLIISNSFSLPFKNNLRLEYVVVFGDSLSDNGNVYKLTNGTYPIPPYWNGRYSNGPNWVDQLNILNISDYAYGSATTDNNLVQGLTAGDTINVPGIFQQVEIYLNNINVNTTDFEKTLFILWGGGNDFIFDQNLLPNMIVVSLFKSVETLLSIGAKNIIVFNQVPVQYFPFSKPFNFPELFTLLTDQANYYLSILTKATQYDNPQISIKLFDVHSIVLDILTQNVTNLTNVIDNCWFNNITSVLQICSNPDEYFFVDTLHFTSRGHQLIADAIRSFIVDTYSISTTVSPTVSPISNGIRLKQMFNLNNILILSIFLILI